MRNIVDGKQLLFIIRPTRLKQDMSDKQQESANRAKSKPVSLYPDQLQFVKKRASYVGSVSRYFQLLVDYDRKNDILPVALKRLAEELEADTGLVASCSFRHQQGPMVTNARPIRP